jgi:diaminohydroxyphosphoribosylaminopyrimidine deaminase / 5-amino-6-(5-phosphoribosylamino)uracil reductase
MQAREQEERGERKRPVLDKSRAEHFMRLALEEAAKGLGRTSPNPVVGAVVVKNGRLVARGWHRQAGTPHAEVVALQSAGPKARGADLYTTLEPCDHFGRTPPCSNAIIEAGVRRVIVASLDPNPRVNGKGLVRLERAGVEVVTGVLTQEADRLNLPFFKVMRTGLPYLTLKAAVTLDGKLATTTGDSRWVTGEAAREWVHRRRDRVDAILVGANTVRADDPQLTTRLPEGVGKDAVRVVVDSRLRLNPTHKVFTQQSSARTVVATVEEPEGRKARRLRELGVEVWQLPAKAGRVDLEALLRRVAKEGLNHVLSEGGAQVFGALLRERLVDELAVFLAPKLVGGDGVSWVDALGVRDMAQALKLTQVTCEMVGGDLLVQARL